MFKMVHFMFHTILNSTNNTFTNFLTHFNGNFMNLSEIALFNSGIVFRLRQTDRQTEVYFVRYYYALLKVIHKK